MGVIIALQIAEAPGYCGQAAVWLYWNYLLFYMSSCDPVRRINQTLMNSVVFEVHAEFMSKGDPFFIFFCTVRLIWRWYLSNLVLLQLFIGSSKIKPDMTLRKINLFITTLLIMVFLCVSEVHVLGSTYRTLYTSQNLNGFDAGNAGVKMKRVAV